MAKFYKKYFLFIPLIAVIAYLWYMFAFTKVECICPWNQWGFIISTITALVILTTNLIITHIWIKNQNKKIYAYYITSLMIGLIIFIIIIRIFMSLLT